PRSSSGPSPSGPRTWRSSSTARWRSSVGVTARRYNRPMTRDFETPLDDKALAELRFRQRDQLSTIQERWMTDIAKGFPDAADLGNDVDRRALEVALRLKALALE